MQISSKMANWEVHKMQKESNPYTVFEAPFPKISLYCKKQQNPTSEKRETKGERSSENENKREGKLLCHICQWDQLQQIQSNQAQDLRHHPFSFLKYFNPKSF